jgi:hypothetical protein
MSRAKTARQIAASKRNLAIARAKRARGRRKAYLNNPHPSKKLQAQARKHNPGLRKPITGRQVRNARIAKGVAYAYLGVTLGANISTIKSKRYHDPVTRRQFAKATVKGGHQFGKGFVGGYKGAKLKKKRAAHNTRHVRSGYVHSSRVTPLAISQHATPLARHNRRRR